MKNKSNKNNKKNTKNKNANDLFKYERACFIKKPLKIIPFKPEAKDEYLNIKDFEYKVKFIFPMMKNIQTSDDLKKLKMSKIGLYSMSYINLGKKMMSIINNKFKNVKNMTLTDANGGVGGLSLQMIDNFKKTNIIELNKFHYDIIKNNLQAYGFSKSKYTIHNKDSLEYVFKLKSDIVIFDPPWFGKDYNKDFKLLSLGLNNVNMVCIVNKLILKKDIKLILILIPDNFDFYKFLRLSNIPQIEIHQVYIKNNKKQSIICIEKKVMNKK
jgi:16S rRNA G966 N2-methylase RsmD